MRTMLAAVVSLVAAASLAAGAAAAAGTAPGDRGLARATFAGGCFWCMEMRFEQVPGVRVVEPGYTGGTTRDPTYEAVATGRTGHVEAIEVTYDPAVISFEGLLQVYFRIADPTDLGGQFVDRGSQYRPVIFYHDARQRLAAERAIAELRRELRYNKPVVVPVEPAPRFWRAEEEHRDFYKKHDLAFRAFRYTNPRTVFQKRVWGEELVLDYARFQPSTAVNGW
jgi:peptide methionine sulfoxide reductase msrA/msrB